MSAAIEEREATKEPALSSRPLCRASRRQSSRIIFCNWATIAHNGKHVFDSVQSDGVDLLYSEAMAVLHQQCMVSIAVLVSFLIHPSSCRLYPGKMQFHERFGEAYC
jgi:hypothetical protein